MIRRQTCPVCEKELPPETGGDSPLFPFCSVRCRQVDLYRWMQGKYAIVDPLDPREIDPEALDPDAGGPRDGGE